MYTSENILIKYGQTLVIGLINNYYTLTDCIFDNHDHKINNNNILCLQFKILVRSQSFIYYCDLSHCFVLIWYNLDPTSEYAKLCILTVKTSSLRLDSNQGRQTAGLNALPLSNRVRQVSPLTFAFVVSVLLQYTITEAQRASEHSYYKPCLTSTC